MAEITQMSPPTFVYETEFQSWLAAHPDALESGLWVVGYEFPIGANRADLLAVDGDGRLVVIEVKRANATREAVGQVLDYVSALEEMGSTEIVGAIDAAETRPEFAAVADFELEFAERYGNAQLSDLIPVRALLAATSESQETGRVLAYLQSLGMDIRSVVFKGALAEDGKRTYQRKRGTRPQDADEGEGQAQLETEDELGEQWPCRASLPKAGTKGRREIEEIHERAKCYPGVGLFWSIHCLILDALPEAHEVPRGKRDAKRQDQCGIALDMPSTPQDEEGGRLEYVVIRLYPVESGVIEIFVYDRAEWRAGDDAALLNTLPERPLYLGKDRRVGVNGRNFWFTPNTWPRHQADFEAVLHAIHKGWKAEREAGRR